jgi:hypothetical protein
VSALCPAMSTISVSAHASYSYLIHMQNATDAQWTINEPLTGSFLSGHQKLEGCLLDMGGVTHCNVKKLNITRSTLNVQRGQDAPGKCLLHYLVTSGLMFCVPA